MSETMDLLDLLDMEDAPAQEPDTARDIGFDAAQHVASILAPRLGAAHIKTRGADRMPRRFLSGMLYGDEGVLIEPDGVQRMSLQRLCNSLKIPLPAGDFKTAADAIAKQLNERYSAAWVANFPDDLKDKTAKRPDQEEPRDKGLKGIRQYQQPVGRHMPVLPESIIAAHELLPHFTGFEDRLAAAKDAESLQDLLMISAVANAFGGAPAGDLTDEEIAVAAILRGAGITEIGGRDPIITKRKHDRALEQRGTAFDELRAALQLNEERDDYRKMKREIVAKVRERLGIIAQPRHVDDDYEYDEWKDDLYQEIQTGLEMAPGKKPGTRRLDNLTRPERVATIKPEYGTKYSDGTRTNDLPLGTIGVYDGKTFTMDRRGNRYRLKAEEVAVLRERKRDANDEGWREITLNNIIEAVENKGKGQFQKKVRATRQRMLDLGVAETTINFLIQREVGEIDELRDAGLYGDTWAQKLAELDDRELGGKRYNKLRERIHAELGIMLPTENIKTEEQYRDFAQAIFTRFLEGHKPKAGKGEKVKEGVWAIAVPKGGRYRYGHSVAELPEGTLVEVKAKCEDTYHVYHGGKELHIYPDELAVAERAFPVIQDKVEDGAEVTVTLKNPDWREEYVRARKRNFPTGMKGRVAGFYRNTGREEQWWVKFEGVKVNDDHGWDFGGKRMRDGYAVFLKEEMTPVQAGDGKRKLEQLRQQYEPTLKRIAQEVESEFQGTLEQRMAIARKTCEDLRSLGHTKDDVRRVFGDYVNDWRAYQHLF